METKLKFKVGEKVRVKSLGWYNSEPKNNRKEIRHGYLGFTEEMKQYCGKVLKISKVSGFYYADSNDYGWEDWMLEDEVVTEQKETTEVIKSMETKEMTLKDAQEFVKNTKYIVWSEDESRKLQKKLFKIGCMWMDGRQEFYGTEQPFLHVDKHLFITFMRKDSYNDFATNSNQYKRTEDILKIKLEQEQTKVCS